MRDLDFVYELLVLQSRGDLGPIYLHVIELLAILRNVFVKVNKIGEITVKIHKWPPNYLSFRQRVIKNARRN